jgi:hypothetical protein
VRGLLVAGEEAEFGEHCEVVGRPGQEVFPRVAGPVARRLGATQLFGPVPHNVDALPQLAHRQLPQRNHQQMRCGEGEPRHDRRQFGRAFEVGGGAPGAAAGVPFGEAAQQFGLLGAAPVDVDADRRLLEGRVPQRLRRAENVSRRHLADARHRRQRGGVGQDLLDGVDAGRGEAAEPEPVTGRCLQRIGRHLPQHAHRVDPPHGDRGVPGRGAVLRLGLHDPVDGGQRLGQAIERGPLDHLGAVGRILGNDTERGIDQRLDADVVVEGVLA